MWHPAWHKKWMELSRNPYVLGDSHQKLQIAKWLHQPRLLKGPKSGWNCNVTYVFSESPTNRTPSKGAA